MTLCYCCSGLTYAQCCEPIHNDHAKAEKPEQLMRARYSAHVLGLVDFVVNTYHSSCDAEQQRESIAESINSDWRQLEVLSVENSPNQDEGFVHFKAHFADHNQTYCLEEKSRFVREHGLWYYIDGEFPQHQPSTKIGRNDPCPCGSGKKYKKCCGK
ncbi:YchJ family metal-binding protein [Vibrio nitrifigilis]|uniref:SEC-C domain-containing protein n=1 Tax=Vibrio nitrifigilis TaxID=2789781 RepID=A0ABS0GCL4_9VIBR|nr:YchJ family metal-binding protein [Vibrio nitrifigilis]MBF9000008.1 SEC-C domain-containing protein [Vibrio nitrifigilis]